MSAQTTSDKDAIISKAIQDISHIATLPEITLKIIDLVEDPTSTAQDLHKVITNDPALCSRILKVVNSAFYGLPGQIGSINRAIVLLGLNAVKNIAIATSLTKLFRGGDLCATFSARSLWMHSIGVAAAARLIANKAGVGLADEAFLAGLLHDIGIMIEMQVGRQQLIEVFERSEKESIPFTEIEEQVFGADHQAFGRALCEKWKFPKSFSYVTGFHHKPTELEAQSRTLTSIIYLADIATQRLDIGFTRDVDAGEIDQTIFDELHLSDAIFAEICEALPEALEEVEAILG